DLAIELPRSRPAGRFERAMASDGRKSRSFGQNLVSILARIEPGPGTRRDGPEQVVEPGYSSQRAANQEEAQPHEALGRTSRDRGKIAKPIELRQLPGCLQAMCLGLRHGGQRYVTPGDYRRPRGG